MNINLIFLAAAAVIVITGIIAEKHVEDESWGRKRQWRQQVQMCSQRAVIRHRSPYCEIGWRR